MLHRFPVILSTVPGPKIFHRLGQRSSTTLSSEGQKRYERFIDEAMDIITLSGSALLITRNNFNSALSRHGLLSGVKLDRFLAEAPDLLLMGVTAGPDIGAEISRLSDAGEMEKAVVYDAAASEITDEALSWISRTMQQKLLPQRKAPAGRRFSAGYGDFPLEAQRPLFDLLEMKKWGVTLTETCIMLPEKSVLALSPVNPLGV